MPTAPAEVPEQARRATWNPAPTVTNGVPDADDTAERPERAVDVAPLIDKELG